MKICSIKLSHDGSIALIDDQRLVFSYEMEKLNNSPRYVEFNIGIDEINAIFKQHGYSFEQIDKFVIDGWDPYEPQVIDLGVGNTVVKLAGYDSYSEAYTNIMQRKSFDLPGSIKFTYSSYLHIAGHIAAAYCTSPMAKAGEDAYVLTWDGGMYPQLFYYHCKTNEVESIGVLFNMIGNIYSLFAQHFNPFLVSKERLMDDLSVAGKVMAYIAKGTYRKEMIPVFNELYEEHQDKAMTNANISGQEHKDRGVIFAQFFAQEFIRKTHTLHYAHEDILYTFHIYLEQLLVKALGEKIKKESKKVKNLCFVGGSALNIKWNSAIRNAGLFSNVWVPPFPNDSGSAIGAGCCEMIYSTGVNCLDWNVFSGPLVIENTPGEGWTKKPATVEELALHLFLKNEPVVFLNERAELGPRALGNRSILAPATHTYMKRILNYIKGREDYRPVAPICLEQDATAIFEPGTKDPYMLFDHKVGQEWIGRIPAICHLDGTARLQTVSEPENPVMFRLLTAYKKLSGVPLLCNTSANHNGKGFFPDVLSVMNWDRVNYVWCNNFLYEKEEKISFEMVISEVHN
jgi:carbamoyltransferase